MKLNITRYIHIYVDLLLELVPSKDLLLDLFNSLLPIVPSLVNDFTAFIHPGLAEARTNLQNPPVLECVTL